MRAFSSALSNHFIPPQKGRKLSGDTLINSVFSAVKNCDIYNLFWKKKKYNIIFLKTSPHPSPKSCLALFHSDNTAKTLYQVYSLYILVFYACLFKGGFSATIYKKHAFIWNKINYSISQQCLQTLQQSHWKFLLKDYYWNNFRKARFLISAASEAVQLHISDSHGVSSVYFILKRILCGQIEKWNFPSGNVKVILENKRHI